MTAPTTGRGTLASTMAPSLTVAPALAFAMAAFLGSTSAPAQGRGGAEPIPAGARLAATCTGCHGTNGATQGDALPSLAGQSKAALLASLMAFKSGERAATVMTQLSKGYTDGQLEQIAEFFSVQPAVIGAPVPSGPGS